MDKAKIKTTLLEIENHDIESARASYNAYFGEAAMAGERVVDSEHRSRSVENRPLIERLEGLIHDHGKHCEVINSISFEPKDKVEPGAVVQLQNRHLVISVFTPEFECEGIKMMGISVQAPIYQAMQGLEQGDEFEVNGKKHLIVAIY